MGELQIDYEPQTHTAVLAVPSGGTAWVDVRRVCEERALHVENTSSRSLTMPWWEFLSVRSALVVTVRKHGLRLSPSESAQRLLEEARSRESAYRAALTSQAVPEASILNRLRCQGFVRNLTKEQLRNISFLAALPSGASFSVPGAGKTTEALGYYFFRRSPRSRLVVVAPKNAFAAWEEQLHLCVPTQPPPRRLTGGYDAIKHALDEDPEISLITYQQLPYVHRLLASFLAKHESCMFLDESHRIKRGHEGVIGNCLLELAHLPTSKLILSGTPLPNSVADLVPQFRFLFPEVAVDETNVVDLVKPIYVRTTNDELGLPPPTRRLVPIGMSPAQARLYSLLRSEEARQAESYLAARDRNWLRRLGRSAVRLLQVASNPALLIKGDLDGSRWLREAIAEGDSPKLRYVCWRVRQLAEQGNKVLVWSVFVENVELLAHRLRDLGAEFIHGGVEAGSDDEADTREAKIRRFHDDPNCRVLIANPAACSEGISLHTVCHYAIYLDRNYNAAQYLQSENRIHRLGLPDGVQTHIEIPYCVGTIDESVDRRLRRKVAVMSAALDDPSLNVDPVPFDPDDLGLDEDDIRDIVAHLRGS